VGNGLSRASPSEELGEFAERLFACDGGESDDEPPEMGEVGGAENFANAFEESLAERGETVYDEHWIFRVRRHFRKRGKFFNRIIPKYPFLLQEQNAKIPWFYDQTNILWKISDVCVCSLSGYFLSGFRMNNYHFWQIILLSLVFFAFGVSVTTGYDVPVNFSKLWLSGVWLRRREEWDAFLYRVRYRKKNRTQCETLQPLF